MADIGAIWYGVHILDLAFMDDVKHAETVTDEQNHGHAPHDGRMIAAVSYVGALCLIPLIFAKDSPFAQEHAKQGLVLAIIELAIKIFGGFVWRIPFGGLLVMIVSVWVFIVSVIGVIKAMNGEHFEIRYVSEWARKIHF